MPHDSLHGADVLCPKCGHSFQWFRFYRLGEVAAMFGVSLHTVRAWINGGDLKVRLWYLGKFKAIKQIVSAGDLAKFTDLHLPVRDEAAEDRVNRSWRHRRELNRKGQKAMIAARRA